MTKFEALFGISKSEIQNTCILMPILNKAAILGFGIDKLHRGKLYTSTNTKNFTLINTGIGAGFNGDAVLYLAETNCKNIVLFGSCGLTTGNSCIGNLVAPIKCYKMESFTDMLLKKTKPKIFYPDKKLLGDFLEFSDKLCPGLIQKVTCVTLGSLKLEEENIRLFKEKAIDIVDMECSAIFSAANYLGLKAMALFYVTDIINKKPFYMPLSAEDSSTLTGSIKNAADILYQFIKQIKK